MVEPRSGRRLVAAFAFLGAVGGWVSVCAVENRLAWLNVLGAFTTLLLAGGLGLFVATRRWRSAGAMVALVLFAADLAGVINGALLGLSVTAGESADHLSIGLLLGGLLGALFALPFIPPLVLVALAARRVGRARVGSLLDGSDRRALGLAVVFAVALAGLAGCVLGKDLVPLVAMSGLRVAAAVGALAILALDARAWLQARAAERALAGALGEERGDRPVSGVPVLDLGLGAQERHERLRSPAIYRGGEQTVRVVRGDPVALRRALARALGCDAAVAALALAALAA